jgi:hypothetical protein
MHLSHCGNSFKVSIAAETELVQSRTMQCTVPTDNSCHSSLFKNYLVTEYRLLSRLFSTWWADRCERHRRPSDHFLHATLFITSSLHVSDNWWWFSKGKHASSVKTKSHDEFLRAIECPVPLSLTSSDWLNLAPICCMLLLPQALRPT